jgi:hypothetical protein
VMSFSISAARRLSSARMERESKAMFDSKT